MHPLGAARCVEIDSVLVVGKSEPERIFELLGRRGEVSVEKLELRDTFAAALADYRERLKDARGQADEIIARARTAAEAHERAASEEAKVKRDQMMEQTRRDIEAETRRAIQEIRKEVADLTVLATEKVTRKTLTEDDQRRLIEDAMSELDFSALGASEAQR